MPNLIELISILLLLSQLKLCEQAKGGAGDGDGLADLLKNLHQKKKKKKETKPTPNYPTSAARGLVRNNRRRPLKSEPSESLCLGLQLTTAKKGLAKIAESCGR